MRFLYYNKLSNSKKRIYDKSDSLKSIQIEKSEDLYKLANVLNLQLKNSKTANISDTVSKICNHICSELKIPQVTVKIKARRPTSQSEELQGLYEMEDESFCQITIWIKTSQKGHTVAFKTFLRTVLHELVHHIDYFYFKLADSLHTQGFFSRESNLFKSIVPAELHPSPKKAIPKRVPKESSPQLTLPF